MKGIPARLIFRFASECALPPQHFVKHHAEAENIATMAGFEPAHLLGRHVADGSHDDAIFAPNGQGLIRKGLGLAHAGQPEVEDLDAAVASEQDVIRLEVAIPGSAATWLIPCRN